MPFASSLSIIVPVFNEEDNLELLNRKIIAAIEEIQPTSWETIYVNDGSTDSSGSLLDKLANQHQQVRPLHFASNQGQTAAFDAGFRAAKGQLWITMDADLQNDPADIKLLLHHLKDDVDCVCGVRVKRRDTLLRRISSHLANRIRNWISDEDVTDTGCSLKLFRSQCFEHIKLYEGMHRFLPTLVKMEGYRMIEVPVSHHERYAGQSKYGVWNRLFKSFFDLLAVRWMKKRLLRYQFKN